MVACGADGLSSACALAMRLKYSNARRSSWMTPSPSAYIRPSFHWATGWPPSAAYCSEFSEGGATAAAVAGAATFFSAWALRAWAAGAAGWAETMGSVAAWLAGAPSNANPGPATGAAPNINARMIRLDVRITLFLVRSTGMDNSAILRFPQRTRPMVSRAGQPFGLMSGEAAVAQFYVSRRALGADPDDVTILQHARDLYDR